MQILYYWRRRGGSRTERFYLLTHFVQLVLDIDQSVKNDKKYQGASGNVGVAFIVKQGDSEDPGECGRRSLVQDQTQGGNPPH